MTSQFLSAFNCRQTHHNSIIIKSKDLTLNKIKELETKKSKIAYSLREKKYVQKQHKSITTINSARNSSTLTCAHKENLPPMPESKQCQKQLTIQPQINISIFPQQLNSNPSSTYTSMIKFNISNSPYQSCYQYDNLRSTQETQLCGAQVGRYGCERIKDGMDKIVIKRVMSSEDNGNDVQKEEARGLLRGKSEENLFNLTGRRNRQYTSVLVQDKFRIVNEVEEQQQQRSPSLHQLTFSPNQPHDSIFLPQPSTMKKHSDNTFSNATHDSVIPSIRLTSRLQKLTEMQIRSTKSIKEEESIVEQFSEVLLRSPLSLLNKKKISLVELLER